MPFAATHILVPMVLVSLIRAHWPKLKHKITLKEVFIAGLFGILPDVDIPLGWLIHYATGSGIPAIHRTFTHTLIAVAIILLVAVALKKVNKQLYTAGLLAALGYFTHIVLDFALIGTIQPFWPFYLGEFGLNILPSELGAANVLAGLDAVLILFWLWHEEKFKKIKSFY